MNNLPKVVTQQRRGRGSNPRLLDRKSDALPLSHRVMEVNKLLLGPAWRSTCELIRSINDSSRAFITYE